MMSTEKLFTKDYSNKDFVGERNREGCNPILLSDYIKRKAKNEHEHGIPINLFNYFGNQGGFEAISDILDPERLSELSGVEGAKIPLPLFVKFLHPFRNTLHYISPEFTSEIVPKFKKLFIREISEMEEKQLKNMSKDQAFKLVDSLSDFLDVHYPPEEKFKIIEVNQLQLALKYLKCPYLEKRLRGITEINKMIEKVTQPQYSGYDVRDMKRHYQKASAKYFTGSTLSEWIIRNDLLGIIMGKSSHAEILRRYLSIYIYCKYIYRSAEVLKLLADEQRITNDILGQVWQCQTGKHEDIVRVIYDTIIDILDNLPIEVTYINI